MKTIAIILTAILLFASLETAYYMYIRGNLKKEKILTKNFLYILEVLSSCETREQAVNAFNWGVSFIERNKPFRYINYLSLLHIEYKIIKNKLNNEKV